MDDILFHVHTGFAGSWLRLDKEISELLLSQLPTKSTTWGEKAPRRAQSPFQKQIRTLSSPCSAPLENELENSLPSM